MKKLMTFTMFDVWHFFLSGVGLTIGFIVLCNGEVGWGVFNILLSIANFSMPFLTSAIEGRTR